MHFRSFIHANHTSELSGALLRGTSLLMEGLALHAIHVDDPKLREFQAAVRGHAVELAREGITPAEVMVLSGAAIHAIDAYARESEHQIKMQMNELRVMAAMLLSALAAAQGNRQRVVAGLQNIKMQLGKAPEISGLLALRQKLAECLEDIQPKGVQHDASTAPKPAGERLGEGADGQSSSDPSKSTEPTPQNSELGNPLDPITGLPGRASAESAIERASQKTGYWAMVPVVVDRIEAVNARFGSKTGDELLMAMVQTLAQKFGQQDQLFRWQGPCFVALVERTGSLDSIRAEMKRLLSPRVNHMVEAAGRTILMTVSFSWTVVPLWSEAGAGTVTEKINDFLAKRRTEL